MTNYDIRPFDPAHDLEAVVNLYNTTFAPLRPYYSWPLTVARFQDRVLGHWEFRPDGLLVAVSGGSIVGFILAAFRAQPLTPQDELTPEWSPVFVSVVAVAPDQRMRGIGRALLRAAGDFARAHGRDRLVIAANPRAPLAFAVGVQEDWRGAQEFLLRSGFEFTRMSQNMVRSIVGFNPTPAVTAQIAALHTQGYECRTYQEADFPALLQLLDEHAWPYWHLDMLSKVGRWTQTRPFMETCFMDCATADIPGPDDVSVVMRAGVMLSFCAQTHSPQRQMAYLGPMLTQAQARNLGLGTVSLQLSLAQAARKGATVCDLWTGTRAEVSHFYQKSGFQPVLRWHDYQMLLEPK
jgi:GNAT superfamily N-acetyltransferase